MKKKIDYYLSRLTFRWDSKWLYVVLAGPLAGEWFIIRDIEEDGYVCYFFILKKIEFIPFKDFRTGTKQKIVDKVKKIDSKLYEFIHSDSVHYKKYERKPEKQPDNRREQSYSSRISRLIDDKRTELLGRNTPEKVKNIRKLP